MDEDLVKGEEVLVKAAELWGEADRPAMAHEASIYTQENDDTVSGPAGQTVWMYTTRAVAVLTKR